MSDAKTQEQKLADKAIARGIAYYDSNRKQFFTISNEGQWIAFNEASLKRRLRWEIFSDVSDKSMRGSLIQKHIMALQLNFNVAYAGQVAGYQPGIHTICGNRILVTSGPRLISPRKGKCDTILKLIEELFGDRCLMVYGWMKCGQETLRRGAPFRPGQMLAMAGKSGCGKSLFQDFLTEFFGGRFAKPYEFLIGEDKWNDDLLGAEHLMIEDEASSTDYRSRRTFGAKLKNLVANQTHMIKRRFTDSIAVASFGRITISLNEDGENLMVLPPIDESLSDKIILLRANKATFPFEDGDLDGRTVFRKKLSSELPAFMSFLDAFEIQSSLRDQRYGICGYQEPSLLHDLRELTPEEELLSMIDHLQIWDVDLNPWKGPANKLQAELLEKDRTGRIKSILSFSTACGVFLERIKRSHPERVQDHRSHGSVREWTIKPPQTK